MHNLDMAELSIISRIVNPFKLRPTCCKKNKSNQLCCQKICQNHDSQFFTNFMEIPSVNFSLHSFQGFEDH
jgi:hypothetical protein